MYTSICKLLVLVLCILNSYHASHQLYISADFYILRTFIYLGKYTLCPRNKSN